MLDRRKRVLIVHILSLRLMCLTRAMQEVLIGVSHSILFIVVMRRGLCLVRDMNWGSSGGPVNTFGGSSTAHDQLLRLGARFIQHGFSDCHLSVLKDLTHVGLVVLKWGFLLFKLGAWSAQLTF